MCWMVGQVALLCRSWRQDGQGLGRRSDPCHGQRRYHWYLSHCRTFHLRMRSVGGDFWEITYLHLRSRENRMSGATQVQNPRNDA